MNLGGVQVAAVGFDQHPQAALHSSLSDPEWFQLPVSATYFSFSMPAGALLTTALVVGHELANNFEGD